METNIEIVIDNSNSMGNCKGILENYKEYLFPDGTTRMELAKAILLNEIIPTIDFAANITVSLFHSIGATESIVQPILYSGKDVAALISSVTEIEIPHKTGGTPITGAILNSINRIKGKPNSDRKIILITDGQETDKKDYKQAAQDAFRLNGITCNIFIIGISLNKGAKLKAESLVRETGGEFINLNSNIFTSQKYHEKIYRLKNSILQNSLSKIKNLSIQGSVEPSILSVIRSELEEKLKKQEKENNPVNTNTIEIQENPEQNEAIRLATETHLYSILEKKYGERLRWVNQEGESGKSFDFEVIDDIDNTTEYFIECKGTIGNGYHFLMTKGEWLFFLENSSNYQIYFVTNALESPKVLKIDNFMKWLVSGKVIPFSDKNIKLKANRVCFSILQ